MKTVIIFGGSGFIGNYIIRRLVKKDFKIIIPYQTKANIPKLKLNGSVGQIIPIKFRSVDEEIIISQIKSANVIINLKTIWDQKKISFEDGIYKFNLKICNYVNKYNPNCQIIYFSGIGVDKDFTSKRSKSIFKSEEYYKENAKNSIIVRPGIVIGGGDKFLQSLLSIIKISPLIPLFGGGSSKFQPVFIDDVALALTKIIMGEISGGHIYDLVGNQVFSYKEFYNLIFSLLNKKRFFINLPFGFAKLIILLLEKTPISPINSEQFELFKKDNISSKNNKSFADLNIKPQDLSEIIKKFLI